MSAASEAPAPIDALDAGVIAIAQLYADVLEQELAGDVVIQLGRVIAPAPMHLVLEQI